MLIRLSQSIEFSPLTQSRYCHSCHHLHIAKAFHLPLDLQKHTRITCDNCEHPILGIGRTSTQTTLASIETNGPGSLAQPSEVNTEPATQQAPSNPSNYSAPLRVNTSLNSGQLSTIAEGHSPAQQSSAAVISSSPDGPLSERSASHDQIHNSQSREHRSLETAQHGDTVRSSLLSRHTISRSSGTLAGTKQRFRDKMSLHFRKTRSITIHRLGIHIEISPTAKPASLNSLHTRKGVQRASIQEESNPSASAANTVHFPNQNSDTPSRSGDYSVPTTTAESSQAPGPGHPDRLIGHTPTQQDKKERIRARRREATLKRKAELMATCECRSECQCRSGSILSNAASFGHGDSDRSIQVPDHVLQSILNEDSGSWTSRSSSGMARGSSLTGIDGHVHFDLRHVSLDNPQNLVLEDRHSFDDRLSQASTVYVRSNESSISLGSRRRSPLRRSNTTPGFPTRHNTYAFRPGVLEALQNRYIPDQVHNTATEALYFANDHGHDAGDTSTPGPDGGEELLDNPGSSRA